MSRIEMYIKDYCSYCIFARRLLASKGVKWKEIDLEMEPQRIEEMIARADGRRTVPQIFVDGRGLGGFDDIAALDRKGELDYILGIKEEIAEKMQTGG